MRHPLTRSGSERTALTLMKSSAAICASVSLAGRTRAARAETAAGIRAQGGAAETAQVDAMDKAAVDAHADQVAATAGSIDISFNAVGIPVVQNIALTEISPDDFLARSPGSAAPTS
jgi:3-oxoacyl-[acyl-carrier protein] reductase